MLSFHVCNDCSALQCPLAYAALMCCLATAILAKIVLQIGHWLANMALVAGCSCWWHFELHWCCTSCALDGNTAVHLFPLLRLISHCHVVPSSCCLALCKLMYARSSPGVLSATANDALSSEGSRY